MSSPYATTISDLGTALDRYRRLGGSTLRAALQVSQAAVPPYTSAIRFSSTFNNCPDPGIPFNALTAQGVVVRIERNDDGATFAGKDRDYTRADLIGWWLDDGVQS
jgi:hypothetical protein